MRNFYTLKVFMPILFIFLVSPAGLFAEALESAPLENSEQFSSMETGEMGAAIGKPANSSVNHALHKIRFSILTLLLTLMAGLIIRFKPAAPARSLFLLGSLTIFGFYNGGCPCVLGSFQNIVLFSLGNRPDINGLILFPGIVLLTFFFGKVFCGWVCHLGAFQEFIYKSNKIKVLKSGKIQTILKVMRYVLLTTLLVQLIITKTNLFEHIDPFRIAFNMTSRYSIGWILLGLLLLTSLFIYRPFCNGVCPVGLVLGLFEKVPWATAMRKTASCIECGKCANVCASNAFGKNADIKHDLCIMCGECIAVCKVRGVSPSKPQSGESHTTLPIQVKI